MKKQMKKPSQAPSNKKIKKKPEQKKSKTDELKTSLKSSTQVKSDSKDQLLESKNISNSKIQSKGQIPQQEGKIRKTRSRTKKIEEEKKKNQVKKIEQQQKPKQKIPINNVLLFNISEQLNLSAPIGECLLPSISEPINSENDEKKQDRIKEEKEKKNEKSLKKSKTNKLMQKYRTKSILDELQNYSCIRSPITQKYSIKMHENYEIDKTHKLYDRIQTLFKLFLQKEKKKSQTMFVKTRYSFFPAFEFLLSNEYQGDHKCCICQFQFEEPENSDEMEKLLLSINNQDIVSLKCSHLLHLQCLKMLIGDKQWFKCPVCSMIYGKMIGDQPQGTMTWSVNEWMKCDGYPDVGTIVIHYSMRGGKRGDIVYPSTGRTAYLPNNIEGNEVLNLLNEAFKRKLIFTIGRSVTTGRDNQIVWNGIHHKTNLNGGSAYFGYPDPTYFDRVKLELAAKGVF